MEFWDPWNIKRQLLSGAIMLSFQCTLRRPKESDNIFYQT
jgi:hypothetical protein